VIYREVGGAVQDANGTDQLGVLVSWFGFVVRRLELFQDNFSTLNNAETHL
jgi:hypothetical protein